MLTFNLKKEWFDKIKSGEKTHEYREVNHYWYKRIKKVQRYIYGIYEEGFIVTPADRNARCTFCLGYPSKKEKNKKLIAVIKNISVVWGHYTDLAISKPVYDIEFEVIE